MTLTERANQHLLGLRPYQPGRPIKEVARDHGIEDASSIVKLASNENPLGPSPRALEAIRRAAAEVHRYPDGGAYHLRNALASKLDVDPGQIVFGNGSNEILELVGHAFLRPGTSAVMSERAFVVYRMVAQLFGAEAIQVPMRGHTHDLDAMAAAIRPDTTVVFVANPNNPTGTFVGKEEVDAFVRRVPNDVLVVFDEAYTELMDASDLPDTLGYVRDGKAVALVKTFSKAYGLAGLRIGYAVTTGECAGILDRAREPFNVDSLAQAAALAALEDEEHVRRTREVVRAGLRRLEEGFERLGLEWIPSVTNFLLVKVGDGASVASEMEKQGVIVRPMAGYAMPEWVRITVGTPEENDRCLEALGRVVAAD